MIDRSRILVVAATARELAPSDGWLTCLCGVGPVEAAVATARAIAERRPAAILHIGIAGARRALGLPSASVVIGSVARYCDPDASFNWAPREVNPAPHLLEAVRLAVPAAAVLPIGTSARVGGTTECGVEAMEGFSVLRAAHVAGVPAIEVRTISNEVEEVDRTRWHFAEAFTMIAHITPTLVDAVRHAIEPGPDDV